MPRSAPSEYELQLDYPEDAPFLDNPDSADVEAHRHAPTPLSPPSLHQRHISVGSRLITSPRRIVILVAVIKFAVIFMGLMLLIPFARILEDSFCHAFYNDTSIEMIDEMKCKTDEIQSAMGFFAGWSGLLSSVIGLIVAFPYGILADKIGRKPTVVFAYAGIFFSFVTGPFFMTTFRQPIRDNPYWMPIGSVFTLFGGGFPVFLTCLYSIASDVSTEEDKATNFLYLTIGAMMGGLFGPIGAGVLMKQFGPWVPIYVVLSLSPVVFVLLFLLPETLAVKLQPSTSKSAMDETLLDSFKTHLEHGRQELVHSLDMLKDRNVPLIMSLFLVQNARHSAHSQTLRQYISKFFHWTLADATLLLSPFGVLGIVVLGGLPKVSDILISRRFKMTAFGKDLFLTRYSTLFLVVGGLVQGFSHNAFMFFLGVFISTFGSADSPLARATVSHYVAPEYTSRLHALISMVEVIGSFIGGPVVAWCFDRGLKLKGVWIGLPWFYVSFLFVLALGSLYLVTPPGKAPEGTEMTSDAEEGDDFLPDNPLRLT